MLSQSFHVLPKALALPDVMITVKRYFDRSATSTLIWLLLFSLAAGHFSNILSDTQGNMLKKKNKKKNTLLQSAAQAGKVPVGDITYAALSKDGCITTIYRASYPNQTVMLTSEYGIHRKNCWVNTALTDIRWLNGFNPGRGVKRAGNGSAVQSLHSVKQMSLFLSLNPGAAHFPCIACYECDWVYGGGCHASISLPQNSSVFDCHHIYDEMYENIDYIV